MSKRQEPIMSIYGAEPMREAEYPQAYIVGHPPGAASDDLIVTKIEFREDNYGDHGLGWFDVWAGETLLASMSARHVADVHYQH